MSKQHKGRESSDNLRQRAEALARKRSPSAGEMEVLSAGEMQQTLHELQVHQIELEMQNEELHRIQAELETSRTRFFDLFELAPVGYLTVLVNRTVQLIQEANLTAAALFGTPRNLLINQPFSSFVVPEDLAIYHQFLRDLNTAKEPCVGELRMTGPGGNQFWAQLVIAPLQQINDTVTMRIVVSDVSEQKELEEALRKSEEGYRLLFESASDALLIVDSSTRTIVQANKRVEELYGYSKEELLTTSCANLAGSEEYVCELLSTGALEKPDGVLLIPSLLQRRKNGTSFQVEITACSLPMDGRPCFLLAIRDISERKHVEAVMAARFRLMRNAAHLSLAELLRATLDEAEVLTGSQIGFFHFMEPDQVTLSLQAWSTNTLERRCTAKWKGMHRQIDHAGAWSDCVHKQRAVIHNDYASLPNRKELPKGHATLIRELVVPIVRDDIVVALIGLGNKESDYNHLDVQVVAQLADMAWDIAERKRAEIQLQESEERYRLLFESASDALVLVDPVTGAILQANQKALNLYGYSAEEVLMKSAVDFSAEPEKTQRAINENQQHQDQPIFIPLRWHRKKDGTVFPVEATGCSLPVGGKRTLLFALRDISERLAAEAALRASEQRRLQEQEQANEQLREQAESLASIYQALDSVGLVVAFLEENDIRIVFFNRGAEKLFGYPQEEVIDQSIAVILPPEHAELISGRAQRFAEGKPMQSLNLTMVRRTGEQFPAVVSVHPFDRHGGRYRKVVGIFRDISELMRAQAELEAINEDLERRVERRTRELQETQRRFLHAEKLSAIGKLSASIAHEFNNPLQGILSILKGLKKRAIMDVEDAELLNAAISESERIKELIRSLQDFHRPTSGKKGVVDIHQALDAIVLLHKSDLKGKGITVQRNYAQDLPRIHAVPDQIKQVFLNLLTNAADACQRPGGEIILTTRREGDNVAICFKDTGIGIKPDQLEQIFQPFFTTKAAVKGTGLGLSVCHGIVRDHRGEITVESRPNEGAAFTVILPIGGKSTAGAKLPPENMSKLS